jgi:hypothetical protein
MGFDFEFTGFEHGDPEAPWYSSISHLTEFDGFTIEDTYCNGEHMGTILRYRGEGLAYGGYRPSDGGYEWGGFF